MKRQTHYLLLTITLALTVVCGILMTRVNVNADMTKYLPDDSQMKHGLDIVSTEFAAASQVSAADVHVMFEALSPAEVPAMCALMESYADVNDVTYRYSADSAYTVFDLMVPKDVDQKALGKQISNRFGGNCVVETSQDGATPPMSVMIIAAVLIMLVLFLMAQSWFEPVVILFSTLVAVILNMGTNALLPSVSITTNFIGSILQAVLSLDYCIILLNRYRQEQDEHTDRVTAGIAANKAIKAAAPSVLSSALTTIVGLLMLCFMRLKIGADMGVVLAKGVLCSLICTFTVMPSLMLLFRRVINKTAKKVYVPPTDPIARFVTSHKVSMALGALVLFVSSWFLSNRTNIFFSAEAESNIEKIFPAPNPFILIYDTEEEEQVYSLVDTLGQIPEVQTIISYPTLLGQKLTPAEMVAHIRSLEPLVANQLPEGTSLSSPEVQTVLSPEMVQIAYYMRDTYGKEQTLTFPEMAQFLHTHCVNNPLFASYIDDEMRQQIELLQSMLQPAETMVPTPQPKESIVNSHSNDSKIATDSLQDTIVREPLVKADLLATPTQPLASDSLEMPKIEVDKIPVVPFIERLNTYHTSALTIEMQKLTDTAAIRLPMSVNEMAFFIGSTLTQTRLVYGYAPNGAKKLSPLQYVHLLTDDLFQRKGLQGLISPEQRTLLSQRAYLMDLADANASLTLNEMNNLLNAFGIHDFGKEEILALYNKEKTTAPPLLAETDVKEQAAPVVITTEQDTTTTVVTAPIVAENKPKEAPKRPSKPKPTREDMQAELFTELVFGGKEYTPLQMAQKLSRLMKLSSVNADPITPEQMSLLYTYYGSVHSACDTMHLSLDQLLAFVCDTLINDTRLTGMVDDSVRTQVAGIHQQVVEGMGALRQDKHSLLVLLTSFPAESEQTYAFTSALMNSADQRFEKEHFYLGESVMYAEMKAGFNREMNFVTLLTIIAIFLIVALTFRSVIVPTILIVTVMTAFYVNVVVSGLISGQILYLAYLIVQAILMGATIDYGILFANYYREKRRTMPQRQAAAAAYKGSIRTILTSGIIMVVAPGVMAALIDDLMISNIVRSLAIGAFVAIVLILTLVPAVLVALDRLVVYGKKNRFSDPKKP